MNSKQYTFSEMSRKMVVNIADGRELGHVCDLVFNNCGGVTGLVVPGKKSFFKSITSADNIFISWNRIIKIGSDVILTELVGASANTFSAPPAQDAQSAPPCRQQPVYSQQAAEQAGYAQYSDPSDQQPYAPQTPQNDMSQSPQTIYH